MSNNNHEELILDILEKTYVKVDQLASDVADIKVQQAVHDVVVKDHAARSDQLEEMNQLLHKRLSRLEDKEMMINGAIKAVAVIGALIGVFIKILPYFHL